MYSMSDEDRELTIAEDVDSMSDLPFTATILQRDQEENLQFTLPDYDSMNCLFETLSNHFSMSGHFKINNRPDHVQEA